MRYKPAVSRTNTGNEDFGQMRMGVRGVDVLYGIGDGNECSDLIRGELLQRPLSEDRGL